MDRATGKVRESEHSTILMYRRRAGQNSRRTSWETPGKGIIAYSAVCTHQGCMVDGWDAATKTVRLPLSSGYVRSLQGRREHGRRQDARDLPQIPVKMHDDKLVVSDAIMSWIGVKPEISLDMRGGGEAAIALPRLRGRTVL